MMFANEEQVPKSNPNTLLFIFCTTFEFDTSLNVVAKHL